MLAGLDELGWIETLGTLAEYSLVEIGGGAFKVHRLVQAVARGRLNEEGQKEWAGRAARLVSVALVTEVETDIASWEVYAQLQGHALAAAVETERLEIDPATTIRLFGVIATYLKGRADYQTALELFKRALTLAEKAYGSESEKVAIYANNLGGVLQALGDLQGAKQDLERSFKIFEKVLGENHPNVATLANNLGLVLKNLGDLQGAKALYERAFKIFEKVLGENHPNVATLANNLGGVLKDLGDLQGAKALYERALRIDEIVYGFDHPEVATDTNNLGSLLYGQGDYAGAKAYFVQALAIRRKFLGEEHPLTKQSIEWLDDVEERLT
jgi:tetratricopeptide (TPR) repeat protein